MLGRWQKWALKTKVKGFFFKLGDKIALESRRREWEEEEDNLWKRTRSPKCLLSFARMFISDLSESAIFKMLYWGKALCPDLFIYIFREVSIVGNIITDWLPRCGFWKLSLSEARRFVAEFLPNRFMRPFHCDTCVEGFQGINLETCNYLLEVLRAHIAPVYSHMKPDHLSKDINSCLDVALYSSPFS